jgi:hypothetical protein
VYLRQPVFVAGVALLLLGSALACKDSSGPLAPYEPQINNVADNFQFQASNVDNITWTYTYRWTNSGDSATVNQATTLLAGAAVLTIFDSTGAQLYSQSLNANGTFGMLKGIAGRWTIKIQFTNYSGTVNFRAQKQ